MDWCHVTFASTSGAIAAQKALEEVCPVVVMPVLRQVSAGCGIALRVGKEDMERVKETLTRQGIPGWELYAITGTGEALRCERL